MNNIYIDHFDRSDGNGSRTREEDWLDQNTTAADNQWSSAATTFYHWEAPSHKKQLFSDLYDAHHGKGDPNRATELSTMEIHSDAETFCAIMELSEPLRERVLYIVEDIDLSANSTGGKPYEKLILAVISLVHDEHLSDVADDNPSAIKYEQRLIFDDTFRDLMESNSLGSKELRGIRERVREQTDHF